MKLLRFFLIFLFFYSGASAQYEQMLHQPYKDKVWELDELYKKVAEVHAEQNDVIEYTATMRKWALANNDKELAYEADLLKAYYYYFELVNNDKPISKLSSGKPFAEFIKVYRKSDTEGLINIKARAAYGIALAYWWGTKNYEKSFEWLLRLGKILDQMELNGFPYAAEHLNFIGGCYYYFKDYPNALVYYKRASKLKKTKFNAQAIFNAQNSLGLCYQKLNQLAQAEKYFFAIIDDTSSYQNSLFKGIASGNLGYNYYLQGNYEKAIPLFKKDIANSISIKDYGLAAGSAIPMADILLKQKKLTASKQKIEEAEFYIKTSTQTDRLRELYPIISKWYAANNEPEVSMVYLDSAMMANKEYNEKYSSLKLLRANQKIEAKDRQLEIQKLKGESQLKLSQRNFIIILIAVLLVISILSYWFRNKYLLKEKQVKELALENTEKALSNAKVQLKNLTLKVRKDNNLILELKKDKSNENNQHVLAELKSKNIFTQEDWVAYQVLFKEVYPDFYKELIKSYSTLSQAEIRCICLEKLQLTNNEMALVLGVSANTIRVTKHRIRKKLNVESQEEMDVLVKKLGN
jgi:DNA-binding CsgD family transcriptional regulator